MKIFLIGLTGAGKSTIGKLLAAKLSYPFIDLDDVIRFETGRTIEDIFEKDGESHFREIEGIYLRKVATTEDRVIATGGGTPCYNQGMDFIKKNGLSIFLNTPVEQVTERLYGSGSVQRPMIKGKSKTELHDFLAEKLSERLPFYTKSDFSIDTTLSETPEKIASMLLVLIHLLEQDKMTDPQQKVNQQ